MKNFLIIMGGAAVIGLMLVIASLSAPTTRKASSYNKKILEKALIPIIEEAPKMAEIVDEPAGLCSSSIRENLSKNIYPSKITIIRGGLLNARYVTKQYTNTVTFTLSGNAEYFGKLFSAGELPGMIWRQHRPQIRRDQSTA